MTISSNERVHTGTQTHGKSWIKRTHSSWWKTQLWLIWWRSTCMLRENLRWEIPFQICPHSCTKTPFKACSTTLGWIYGAATFYPKCSDFSTKSLSPSSQRPPGSPLSPSRNNSSDRKKGKCLVQLFQFWFQVFRFLYCEPPCTHPSYLNRCKFVRRQRAKSDFSREIGFSTHAEDSEAPGKYLEHFTRHL